jgi:hypothetical protein
MEAATAIHSPIPFVPCRLAKAPLAAVPASQFDRYLLNVDFESAGGQRAAGIGGGGSVAEAIAAARNELPVGYRWNVVRWNDLFGE